MEVIRYNKTFSNQWNCFLSEAKNGSFFFNRDYIEYHSDRFDDFSLLVFNGKELVSILPANIKDGIVFSYQGLTFGGFVFNKNVKLNTVLGAISSTLFFLKKQGICELFYKAVPRFYHSLPADEIDWALFILNAELIRRDTAMAIDYRMEQLPYQERRLRSIKKAAKLNPIILSDGKEELIKFWEDVLEPNLQLKHGVKPVHSKEEILLLAERFPNRIKQFNIYSQNKIMAGSTMFLNNNVAHAQYISGTEEGRSNGSLDFLFNHLIQKEFKNYSFFDFGICNENGGYNINKGLLDWKEGFGARTLSHDFYKIQTSNFHLLENI